MAVSNSFEEEFIEKVVESFYRKATTDFLIGYHFRKIALAEVGVHPLKPPLDAFSHHLPRINDFWKSQLLGIPIPKNQAPFNLIGIHRELLVRKGEINRWIILFQDTLNEEEEHAPELTLQWREKVKFFQKKFLEHI